MSGWFNLEANTEESQLDRFEESIDLFALLAVARGENVDLSMDGAGGRQRPPAGLIGS